MFERFTADARAVVVGAQEEARRLGSPAIGPGHLLLAVVTRGGDDAALLTEGGLDGRGLAGWLGRLPGALDADALGTLGIDLDEVRRRADEVFGPGALDAPAATGRTRRFGGHIPFTNDAKKVLELALREAIHLGDREIRTDHLLLGLSRPRTAGADVLRAGGADPERLRAALLARRAA
jgi:ATP-dependent Clp protease ATP-binding subunit ClpA